MPSSRWLAVALAIASFSRGVSAQDVEMLGRRYGTRPPAGYYRELARDPDAFRFTRGRAARLREAVEQRAIEAQRAPGGPGAPGPAGAAGVGGPALSLGPRTGPVVGDIYVPVVLGLFDESPAPPYSPTTIQSAYFGAQPGAATVSTYYAEVSSDSISLDGEVRDWVRSTRSEAETTQGESSLVCCGIGDYIKDILSMQGSVDWGLFDNDGPDGLPNSGDDDGYVDALAVMHPSHGAECDGSDNRIWSHKWALRDASSGGAYQTTTPALADSIPYIKIDDYFVQGVLSCPQDGTGLNPIGVFVHETGHAFGLPDLYDTRQFGDHAGAGYWDLMASGTYGCSGGSPALPCHMGAWSKAMLGWVDVVTLAPGTDFGTLTLPPVEAAGVVYRVDAGDGSDEYFLLENRQEVAPAFDKNLLAEGLLVWQIDWDVVLARWAQNTVNSNAHMGVWLRQADGQDDLGRSGGGRGDSGDPFPGLTSNTAFHAASSPASVSFQGSATGLTMLGIAGSGDDVEFDLLTRFTTLTVEATGTSGGGAGLFTVNALTVAGPPSNFVLAAPFESRTIAAAAGEPLGPGERRPFDQWIDEPAAPRTRVLSTPLVDTTLTAAYAGTEYELAIAVTGGVNGVSPGSFTAAPAPADPTSPGLWFEPGLDVEVTAIPQTGFTFAAWTGALEGQPNPASVTMTAPAQAGADFQLTYAVADVQVGLTATVAQDVQLVAQNGTAPITWELLAGTVPQGLALGLDGRLTGASLDLGTYPLTVRATDAIGLTATATLTLDVARPSIPIAELASAFLLGGPALDPVEAAFLDRQGNGDGTYDLGDFRAWVLANPSLPLSAELGLLAGPEVTLMRTLEVPVWLERQRPGGAGEKRP